MFAAKNPFEDVVTKATSDELTSEDWQLNLDICDRISSEGETGARNCVAAIQKRLIHRNANVQLYALTLSDTLAKNCGLPVHQELASRAFTQTLSRISLDRNTHATVKKRCLSLIKQWANDFDDESLDLMCETYEALKQQNADFEDEPESERPEPSSEQLRAEDEELRRVLELSVQDQGGRNNWISSHPSEAIGQSSSSTANAAAGNAYGPRSEPSAAPSASAAAGASSHQNYAAPTTAAAQASAHGQGSSSVAAPAVVAVAPSLDGGQPVPIASRVRALYDFSPTEPGELAFSKGDVIRVLDSVYEHWWRGEVRGEAGIFPVNYVEVLPDPTPEQMQREAEMEARIFSQAASIDLLLSKLRGLDPMRDNLTEDDELQELYQSSLAMRPKIVKLIDRYSTKVTELKAMNDKFVRARGTFDEMMEQSLARYNPAGQSTQDYLRPRPDFVQHASAGSIPQQHQQPQGPVDYGAHQQGAYGPPLQQQPQQQYVPGGHQPQQAPPPPQSQADYAQWYHAQQQQQQQAQPQQQPNQQQHPPQQALYAPQQPAHGASSSSVDVSSYAVSPAPVGRPSYGIAQQAPPQDNEKRRLYERARAEGEAFQQQHFAGGGSSGGPAPGSSVAVAATAAHGAGGSSSGAGPAGPAYNGGVPPQHGQGYAHHHQQQDSTTGLTQGVAGMSVNGAGGGY